MSNNPFGIFVPKDEETGEPCRDYFFQMCCQILLRDNIESIHMGILNEQEIENGKGVRLQVSGWRGIVTFFVLLYYGVWHLIFGVTVFRDGKLVNPLFRPVVVWGAKKFLEKRNAKQSDS